MMSRSSKAQILDLGTHLVKALVVEATAAGRLAVVGARALPLACLASDVDSYLSALGGPLAQLARSPFRAGSTVHVVSSEGLVRTGIRRLVHSGDAAIEPAIRQSRQQFIELHGVHDKTFASSVIIRREDRGDASEILVAHAYVRWMELETLRQQLAAAGLTLGRLLPRLAAIDALCESAGALLDQWDATLVIDAGFATTGLGILGQRRVIRHSVVFAGALDLLSEDGAETPAAHELTQPSEPFVADHFDSHRMVAYARAVRYGIEQLPPWPSPSASDAIADEGGEEDHEDSLDRGDLPHSRAILIGGLAHCPGFAEALAKQLGVETRVLAPDLVAKDARKSPTGAPLGLFGCALGAAVLVTRDHEAEADVAAEYTAVLSAAAEDVARPASPRRILALAACLLLFVLGSTARSWFARRAELARLTADVADLEARMPSDEECSQWAARVRRALRVEELADRRLGLLNGMCAPGPDWFRLLEHLQHDVAEVAVAELTLRFPVDERPATPRGTSGGEASYELKGEAIEEHAEQHISRLVGALQKTATYASCRATTPLPQPTEQCHLLVRRGHKRHQPFTLTGTLSREADVQD